MTTLPMFWIVPLLLIHIEQQQIMAVALNKSKSLNECNHPLGVGDRQIADSQLTSPSFVSTLYIAKDDVYINAKPNYGRLNDKYAFCGGRFSYLQVNLGYVVNVTAVATQGLEDWSPSFVKTYRLRFSLNGQDWFDYSTPNKVWRGNINGRGIKRNNFNSSIQTQYLRIYPLRYNFRRCLRVEVYGCKSSDPGQSESTSTTPRLTTSVTDKKVTSVETDVTTPKNDAKVDVTTPKNDAKVDVTTPKNDAKVDVTTPKNDAKVDVTTPKNDAKVDVTTPKNDAKVDVTTPMNDTKVDVTTPKNDAEVDVTTPKNDTKVDVTTPKNDAKVDVTTPMNDAKVTPTKAKDLSVTRQWKDIVTTEAPVLPHDVDHSKNNALLLGICIGGVVLITLTVVVFMLLKFKTAENRDADNRLVKKEFV